MRYQITFIFLFGLSALTPLSAGAQVSTDEAREKARVLADEGLKLYEEGQYDEAIERFREAEGHFHALTILLMLARAYDKNGEMLKAQGVYHRIVKEELVNYAPRVFFQSQETAKQELAALTQRIPTLEITIRGVPLDDVQITLDGVTVKNTLAGQPLPQNPGKHTVVVTLPSREPVRRTVVLSEGTQERVAIEMRPMAGPTGAAAGNSAWAERDASRVSRDAQPSEPWYLPGAIALGVGGLALGVGTVTGAIALSKVSELDAKCPERRCGESARESYETTGTLTTASTVGFAVGGGALATGAALLFLLRPASASPVDGAGRRADMLLGPGWVGAAGVF